VCRLVYIETDEFQTTRVNGPDRVQRTQRQYCQPRYTRYNKTSYRFLCRRPPSFCTFRLRNCVFDILSANFRRSTGAGTEYVIRQSTIDTKILRARIRIRSIYRRHTNRFTFSKHCDVLSAVSIRFRSWRFRLLNSHVGAFWLHLHIVRRNSCFVIISR